MNAGTVYQFDNIAEMACTVLFYATELVCYCYLVKGSPRRLPLPASAALVALFAVLLFALTMFVQVYQWEYVALYALAVCTFLAIHTRMGLKETLFYVVLVLLTSRTAKHVVGHFCIVATHKNLLVEGGDLGMRVVAIVVNALIYLLIFYAIRRFLVPRDIRSLSWPQVLLAALAAVPAIYINFFIGWSMSSESGMAWALGTGSVVMECICAFCGVMVVVGGERATRLRIADLELAFSRRIIEQQHEQYVLKKEAIDDANRKYHDLRFHLAALQATDGETGGEDSLRARYAAALSHSLEEARPVVQTGSELLDITVSEAMRTCEASGIEFTVLADGASLGFVDPVDQTAIVSNALENAIEAARQAEVGRRTVTLKVARTVSPFVAIKVENSVAENSELESRTGTSTGSKAEEAAGALRLGGTATMPPSPKGSGHGYGLRNIQTAAQRYSGTVTLSCENGIATLTVLIADPAAE